MKILHLGKYYPPFRGGIENFMCSLMEQQKKDGHQVSAIVHHHVKDQPLVTETHNDIAIYRVPYLGQLLYVPISPTFFSYLNLVIKREKPDIIHIHTPNLSAFWCLFLSSAKRIPWVIQWQSDVIGAVPNFKIKLLYPFYRIFEKALLNRAQRIIVASPSYATSSKALDKYSKKIDVIPLALPDKDVIPTTIGNRVYLNLLMIGRLTYYKGHKILINALGELKNQGFDFRLNIIGEGELFFDIKKQIDNIGLSGEIRLLGKQSDDELMTELGETDLLCLPSIERTEAFGMVLLEAMRASKPCLVSDVQGSGMSWVVQDNKTGFVAKHNDVKSLVNKLKYIVEHKELLVKYGAAGRKRFEKYFSISIVSGKITNVYKSI